MLFRCAIPPGSHHFISTRIIRMIKSFRLIAICMIVCFCNINRVSTNHSSLDHRLRKRSRQMARLLRVLLGQSLFAAGMPGRCGGPPFQQGLWITLGIGPSISPATGYRSERRRSVRSNNLITETERAPSKCNSTRRTPSQRVVLPPILYALSRVFRGCSCDREPGGSRNFASVGSVYYCWHRSNCSAA